MVPLTGPDSSPLISRQLDSDTGISAAAVRQDPNLLTQFAEPDKRESRTGQLCQTKVTHIVFSYKGLGWSVRRPRQ